MSESKPFASLSPTLLARKGAAKPAMKPQWGAMPTYSTEVPQPPTGDELEDLGWNDMGEAEEVDSTPESAPESTPQSTVVAFGAPDEPLHQQPLTGGVPEVVRQQDALAGHVSPGRAASDSDRESSPLIPLAAHRYARGVAALSAAAANAGAERHSALAEGRRAAFTLRVDETRHLKLRLACTMQGRSAQQLVTQALDRLLEELPELDDLAKRVRRR